VLTLIEILPINVTLKNFVRDTVTAKMGAAQTPATALAEWTKLMNWNSDELSKSCYYLMSLEELMVAKKEAVNQEQQQQEVAQKQEFCGKLI
jgi:hypothetical protein